MSNRANSNLSLSDDIYEEVGKEAEQQIPATKEDEIEIDKALNLQMISIRLQSDLLSGLKNLAKLHGIGYQPLIREILTRWVNAEMKQMAIQYMNELSNSKQTTSIPEIEDLDTPKKKKCA